MALNQNSISGYIFQKRFRWRCTRYSAVYSETVQGVSLQYRWNFVDDAVIESVCAVTPICHMHKALHRVHLMVDLLVAARPVRSK
jgi:hypothetical protein